jgi:hypothetical protein
VVRTIGECTGFLSLSYNVAVLFSRPMPIETESSEGKGNAKGPVSVFKMPLPTISAQPVREVEPEPEQQENNEGDDVAVISAGLGDATVEDAFAGVPPTEDDEDVDIC